MAHSGSYLSRLLVLCTITLNLIHSKSTTCDVLGVHPDDCDKYSEPNSFFFCGGDKTKKLPLKYLNDDYCDCVGTNDDEPGTSACNQGKFWCNNIGFRGRFIYSSWVNDGICDCCDGSDEIKNDRVACENTCREKAKEELQDIIVQKKKYMEAIKIKQSLLRIASSKMNEEVTKKESIEKELAQKRVELKEKEQLKNIAEEKESEYKEDKKRQKEEERARKREEKRKECEAQGGDKCDEIETENDSESKQDAAETHESIETEHEETASERLRRKRKERREQRLARNKERKERRKLRREQEIETESESEAHHEHTPDEEFPYPEQYRPHEENQIETEHVEHTPDEEFPYPKQYRPHDEDGEKEKDDGFDWSEFDDEDDDDYDDEDLYAEYLAEIEQEKERKEEEDEEEEVDQVANELSNSAADARREYNNINRDIRDLEKNLEEANKILNTHFGEKNIYASLLNECFSIKIEKYEYEFCPFKNAKQKEAALPASSTDLGSFKGFEVNEDNETVMRFDGGQKCWNGPKRSANVIFKCDTQNEVAAVTEPSTCKYSMTFHTPLVCRQEELDKLTDLIENQFKTEL